VKTLLDTSAAEVFYDGLFTEPMLDHPEGLAVHWDGSVWCGGEPGQFYRIEPAFSQGVAFDRHDNL